MSSEWVKLLLTFTGAFLVLRYVAGVGIGAPYFPIRKQDIEDAFSLHEICADDVVVDLGSGDGRLLLACARRGATVIGYELNPVLVWISRWRLRAFPKAKVYRKNLFNADLKSANTLFIFGLSPIMEKVSTMIQERASVGITVISFAFELPKMKKIAEKGIVMKYRNE